MAMVTMKMTTMTTTTTGATATRHTWPRPWTTPPNGRATLLPTVTAPGETSPVCKSHLPTRTSCGDTQAMTVHDAKAIADLNPSLSTSGDPVGVRHPRRAAVSLRAERSG